MERKGFLDGKEGFTGWKGLGFLDGKDWVFWMERSGVSGWERVGFLDEEGWISGWRGVLVLARRLTSRR